MKVFVKLVRLILYSLGLLGLGSGSLGLSPRPKLGEIIKYFESILVYKLVFQIKICLSSLQLPFLKNN